MIRRNLALMIALVVILQGSFTFGFTDTYLIYEDSSNIIIKGSNEDISKGIASVTKLMTYLLAMEAIDEGKISMDDVFKVTRDVDNVPYSYWLATGDEITVRKMIESLLVISANDSAYALGVMVAGSEEAFAEMMNKKCDELGLTDSVFYNASGLTLKDGSYNKMSMTDLQKLVHVILEKYGDEIIPITSTIAIKNPNSGYEKNNTNHRLLKKDSHIKGLKTGYTDVAGSCLVSIYVEGDAKYVNLTVGNPSRDYRDRLTYKNLMYAKDTFVEKDLYLKDEKVLDFELLTGKKIDLVPLENVHGIFNVDSTVYDMEFHLKEGLSLPVTTEDEFGTVELFYMGHPHGSFKVGPAVTIE